MSAHTQESNGIEIALEDEPVARRIGLIALATDHTSELDFARICDPAEVGVYVNRIAYENPTTLENLRKTGPLLTAAAAEILPGEHLDVIAYSCTAASVVLGDAAVTELIRRGKPGAACVTPPSAAFAAFEALGVESVSILTPYTVAVTEELAAYFRDNRLEVVSSRCLGFEDDRQMARIKPASIIAAAVEAIGGDADALFISCTALRAAVCVGEIERRIGRPVVTSNQAMIWRSLRLAGIERPIAGYGHLFHA